MPNDNAKSLQALLKVFDTTKIVSPEDITAVLAGVTKLLADFKKQNEQLNGDTKTTVEALLTQISAQQQELLAKVGKDTTDTKAQLIGEVDRRLKGSLQQAQDLIHQAKAAMPEDGKDAKPEDVVPLVMAQIQLPEQKDVILDNGEEIVAKINGLSTDDDQNKIDASHVKNLPQLVQRFGGGIAGNRNITIYDETTIIAKAIRFLKFVGTGVQATAVGDVITVTIPGSASSITPADELATDSGNHTTFTISHTPVAGTLLVINENTGQAVPTSAYTNTTTSLIFNQSQQVDDGTGNLVTPTFRARYFY